MLENLKSFFVERAIDSRLHFFKPEQELTDFKQQLANVGQILVVMPVDGSEQTLADQFLERLKNLFQNAGILAIDVSDISGNQVNWIGVPNREYLSGIQSGNYDLFIDLNSRQIRLCSYICAFSNARLRLHLSSGRFDKLYNLQFRTSGQTPLATRYENLYNYLRMLRGV